MTPINCGCGKPKKTEPPVVVALILAIVSIVDQRYPWLSAAVICLAVSLLI